MVQDKPYVHWKIKDAVDLTEIDPVYLWGTVIETDKGPIDEPVFITNAKQGKKIFNYDFSPFFANGGRYLVIVRAYSGTPKFSEFNITLDKDFSYATVEYDTYSVTKEEKANIKLVESTINNERPTIDTKTGTDYPVTFYEGRWCLCNAATESDSSKDGIVKFFYKTKGDNPVIKEAVAFYNNGEYTIYEEGATADNIQEGVTGQKKTLKELKITPFTKGFNESDITRVSIAKIETIEAGVPVVKVQALYPGNFLVPITVGKDTREGYRISITESDDYTIMLSGATTLEYIVKRINERAENIVATLTDEGKKVQKAFSAKTVPAIDADGKPLHPASEQYKSEYDAVANKYPVGSIFAKIKNTADENDTSDFSIKLTETVANLAGGSNGDWNKFLHRIADPHTKVDPDGINKILQAHRNALDHLATIKLAGIFCMYGEDQLQKVYADHVSTTEPQGMNSAEVCKWRTLIVGANALDRTNDPGETIGFKLGDKAVAFDNENIIFLGQGLIDDGYIPEANVQSLVTEEKSEPIPDKDGLTQYVPLLGTIDSSKDPNGYGAYDKGVSQYQLLPFQCTQYIAGLRSKLFYGDAIFGGEAKKEIFGVGNMTIAPLFNGENKLLWQPDAYTYLNEHGVLTFTEDYNILSLTDGVTTRQSPLEEDEEGVQSIVKYAKHAVHEVLQTYIGRNITSDLQTAMESSVRAVLTAMQTQDQTLLALPSEGYDAFDIDIVLVPKSNAKQILAKAYVYLKLTPVHALRQIEVELTVQ